MKHYGHVVALPFLIKAMEDGHIRKARWVEHPDTLAVHFVCEPRGWHYKETLGSKPEFTLFPTPGTGKKLTPDQVKVLSCCGVKDGHTIDDAITLLMAAHPHSAEHFDPELSFPVHSF